MFSDCVFPFLDTCGLFVPTLYVKKSFVFLLFILVTSLLIPFQAEVKSLCVCTQKFRKKPSAKRKSLYYSDQLILLCTPISHPYYLWSFYSGPQT